MKQLGPHPGEGSRVAVATVVSVVVHLLAIVVLAPLFIGPPPVFEPPDPPEPEKPFEVSVVSSKDVQLAPRPEPEPEPEPEIEPTPKEQPKPEPKPIEKLDRRIVRQVTNQERPEEAKFLSSQDNRTQEETRATETTTEEVVPSNTERDKERAMLAKAQMPDVKPVPTRKKMKRKLADPSELIRRSTEATQDPQEEGFEPSERRRKLFEVSEENYEEIVGHEHDDAAHEAMQEKRLLAGWEEDERIMRGALENFITDVKPGNHTSVNAYGRAWADYLGRIHRRIHARWAADYLATLDLREPAGSPLNDPTLNTKLEIVIRASDGKIQRINIVKTSGELRFDAEAISISTASGPHPRVPEELVSPDGNVYVHWNFWRNQRQCGVFGASVFIVEKDELSRD